MSIRDLPVQHPRSPASAAEARARFFNSGNAFDIRLPEVPDHIFLEPARQALDPGGATGLYPCDLSEALHCAFAATTPLILVRYARVRAGESLSTDFTASGVIGFVIQGRGTSTGEPGHIRWSDGDVFVLPGGQAFVHQADTDAVLWLVSNEPQLAFEALGAPPAGRAPTALVHYRADEIARQLELIQRVGRGEATAGTAVLFSSDQQEAQRNVLPTLTLALNALPPGGLQRAHRHNAAAVMLLIDSGSCHSLVDGRRKDWAPWATTVTPPGCVHSHHNAGDRQARFLVVQDGGLYYHLRAMGFSFAEHPVAAQPA